MAAETVLVDVRGPVAVVTLNRPDRLNALALALVAALDAARVPAIDEGLFPGMAPYRLPRLVGRGRAAELR